MQEITNNKQKTLDHIKNIIQEDQHIISQGFDINSLVEDKQSDKNFETFESSFLMSTRIEDKMLK